MFQDEYIFGDEKEEDKMERGMGDGEEDCLNFRKKCLRRHELQKSILIMQHLSS